MTFSRLPLLWQSLVALLRLVVLGPLFFAAFALLAVTGTVTWALAVACRVLNEAWEDTDPTWVGTDEQPVFFNQRRSA